MHNSSPWIGDVDSGLERPPTVDLVVPVYNEEAKLCSCIRRTHSYLSREFPFTWRITIVDCASADTSWPRALELSHELTDVRALRMDRSGRGFALQAAWNTSDSDVLACMEVGRSHDVHALLPLVAPLVSGHSAMAVGRCLERGRRCAFKAVRADVARRLLPEVCNDTWLFDTELLLLAKRNGLRIAELPVEWIDDRDTRVGGGTTTQQLKDVFALVRHVWRQPRVRKKEQQWT